MPGFTRAGQIAAASVLVMVLGGALVVGSAGAQTVIVGNDEKVAFDENNKSTPREPGHDTLSVVDVSKPDAPVVAATIPLPNTVVGPPVNLAIHPSGAFALVANSVNSERDGDKWKNVPDDKVFVVDLKANPPKVVATVNTGKQPSGLAISPKGDMALVTNRADGTVGAGDQWQGRREGDRHRVGRRAGRPGQRGGDHARTASARWRPKPTPTRSRS